ARQAKADLGLGRAPKNLVAFRIARRRVAHHREAVGACGEGLALFMDRARAAPPPRAMDERPVRRIRVPEHRRVDAARQGDRLEHVGTAAIEAARQRRRWWRAPRVLAEEDPDI